MEKEMKPFVGARVRIVGSTEGLGYVVTQVTPRTFRLKWFTDSLGIENTEHEHSHGAFLEHNEELIVDPVECFKALKKCIKEENQ